MKSKPTAAYIIGGALLLVAASFPAQISYWFDHHLINEFSAILSKLTWLNYIVIGSLAFAGYQTMTANLNKVTPLVLFGLVGLNNYVVGRDGGLYSMVNTMLATAALGITLTVFVRSNLFKVLSDKRQQWWRSATRKRVQVPIRLAIQQLQKENWKTIDISSTGMFLKAENGDVLKHPKLKVGSHFPIYIENQTSPINVEIVRKQTDKKGRYNGGIGLRFVDLQSHQRSLISEAMA
jgi:hypothetical protein